MSHKGVLGFVIDHIDTCDLCSHGEFKQCPEYPRLTMRAVQIAAAMAAGIPPIPKSGIKA